MLNKKQKEMLWTLMLETENDYDYLHDHYTEMVGEEPQESEEDIKTDDYVKQLENIIYKLVHALPLEKSEEKIVQDIAK